MSENILESYLVKLGASVDTASFGKFNSVLKEGEKSLSQFSLGAVAGFAKFESAAIGAFAAVGVGLVGLADKTAQADLQYQLIGTRMLMGKDAARAMTLATNALGASLDEIAYNPELMRRFNALYEWNIQLGEVQGKNFEQNMVSIRDLTFEYDKFQATVQALARTFVSDLFEKLGFGSGEALGWAKNLNQWFAYNMPKWADEIATDVVPVVKDLGMILNDLKDLAKDVGLEFTNIVALFSGDHSIEGATFDFHKFATAVEHVAHGLAVVVHWMLKAEQIATRFAPILIGGAGGGALGGGIGTIGGAVTGALAGTAGGPLGMLAGAGLGALSGGATGTAIGTVAGGVAGGAVMIGEEALRGKHSSGLPSVASNGKAATSAISDQARALAAKVGKDTGIDPALVFAQWAHETGNFTNRGAISLNNFAGIKNPGGSGYRTFGSGEDFANYWENLITKRYPEAARATTPEQFAHGLKRGTIGAYMEDSEDNYANGMRSHIRDYGQGQSVTNNLNVAPGAVVVNVPPDTSKEDAKEIAASTVTSFMQKRTRNTMMQTAGGWAV